jgi:hypothetical protein
LRDRDVVTKLFDELGPRYGARPGGYLRILKFGFRVGDNAPMALVELMDRPEPGAATEDGAEAAGTKDAKAKKDAKPEKTAKTPKAAKTPKTAKAAKETKSAKGSKSAKTVA